jgi:hypothetical protein
MVSLSPERRRELKEAREALVAFASDWALKGQVQVSIISLHTFAADRAIGRRR